VVEPAAGGEQDVQAAAAAGLDVAGELDLPAEVAQAPGEAAF